MFARWVAATNEYDAAHGTAIVAVASLGGKVKGRSLNLEDPAVRANMLAGVQTVLELGAGARLAGPRALPDLARLPRAARRNRRAVRRARASPGGCR